MRRSLPGWGLPIAITGVTRKGMHVHENCSAQDADSATTKDGTAKPVVGTVKQLPRHSNGIGRRVKDARPSMESSRPRWKRRCSVSSSLLPFRLPLTRVSNDPLVYVCGTPLSGEQFRQ